MKRLQILFSIAFCLALLAPDARAEEGVTKDTIRLGTWAPQTGPAAAYGAISRAMDIYFQYINENGGVLGRKLELVSRDDSYSPPKTRAAVKEMSERGDGVFAYMGGVGTATGLAVKDYIVKKKTPWICPTTGSSEWAKGNNKYIFACLPRYEKEGEMLADYAVTKLGAKKVGVLYQNDGFGEEGLRGVLAGLKKHGMKPVEQVSYEVTDANLSAQAMRLKASGADTVILVAVPKPAAMFAGERAKLGWNPNVLAGYTVSDPVMFHIAKQAWEGVIMTSAAIVATSDDPRAVMYRELMKKYGGEERLGVLTVAGIGIAELVVEGLTRAGKDLTREKFITAMESLKNWHGIAGKMTFAPDKRQGSDDMFFIQAKGGKLVRLKN